MRRAAKTDMDSVGALLPGARIEMLNNVGHWPEAEDPEQFVRLFLDFVGQQNGSANRYL